MEREACVCDHGFERSDLCAEVIIIIIIILSNYIDHAGTPNKPTTEVTIGLDYSSLCYIASRIG